MRFEGVWKPSLRETDDFNPSYLFLPYNPTIVIAGGYAPGKIRKLADNYPQGSVYVFEPEPEKFSGLLKEAAQIPNVSICNAALNTHKGCCSLYLYQNLRNLFFASEESSLLEPLDLSSPSFRKKIQTPCVRLEDWILERGVPRIDLLELDLGGFELAFLKNIPNVLKGAIAIHIKTHLSSEKKDSTQYAELKDYLKGSGFELLSHWYLEEAQGEATFIQRRIYDAMFL